jgi:hypothetical protein
MIELGDPALPLVDAPGLQRTRTDMQQDVFFSIGHRAEFSILRQQTRPFPEKAP